MTAPASARTDTAIATLSGMPEGQDALVLRDRAIEAQRKGALALHVALDEGRVATLVDLLAFSRRI